MACHRPGTAVLWCTRRRRLPRRRRSPPLPPSLPQAAAARPAVARQPALAAVQHAAAPLRHAQQRRSLAPCRAAEAEAAEAAPAAKGQAPAAEAVKPKLMSEAWEEVIQMKQEGTVVETTVKAANKSGACRGGTLALVGGAVARLAGGGSGVFAVATPPSVVHTAVWSCWKLGLKSYCCALLCGMHEGMLLLPAGHGLPANCCHHRLQA